MSNNPSGGDEQVGVDLSVNTEQATRNIEQLQAAAESLDATMQRLQASALRIGNSLKIPDVDTGKAIKFDNYADLQGHVANLTPEQVWTLSPRLGQTMAEIQGRREQTSDRIASFAQDNPDAVTQARGSSLYDRYARYEGPRYGPSIPPQMVGTLPQDYQSFAQPQTPTYGPQVTPAISAAMVSAMARDMGTRLGQPTPPTAPTSSMGFPEAHDAFPASAYFTPPSVPTPAIPTPGGGQNDTPEATDRTATTFATHIASALTNSAGGLLTGGLRGAADAGGLGVAGDVAGGLVRPLLSLLGDAALPIAGLVAGAGAALGVNNESAHLFGEERTLSGTVGARRGATPAAELSAAQNVGWGFNYHEGESVRAASQLGAMGVDNSQMAATLTAAMAMARTNNMDLGQTTQLAGQYAQTGMSGQQILQQFTEMDQAARLTGVSVARLTDGIKQLNQSAGLGALSVTGLAATQAMVGPELNVGQALAPAIGAQGSQAIQMQAMLGLNPQQFLTAQRHPEQLWDAYGRLAKQYDRGTYGTDVAEQALQTAGLDLSSLKGPDAANVVNRLVTQGPRAAEDYYNKLQQQEHPAGKPPAETPADYLAKAVQHANDITSAMDRASIKAEQVAVDLANAARSADHIAAPTPTELKQHATDNQSAAERLWQNTQVAAERRRMQVAAGGGNSMGSITDPSATEPIDTSGTADFGPLSEKTMHSVRANGLWVGGGPGHGAYMDQETSLALEQAARRTGVPFAVLAAQARQEATNPRTGRIDPSLVGADGGYGLAQFTDQRTAVQYLNQASHQLGPMGMGAVTAANWHQAALNPRIAAQAMADYDAANLASKQAKGRWDHALAEYNAGPDGWNYTGHPGQGRDYGTGVYSAAEKIQIEIGGTVNLTHPDGSSAGKGRVTSKTHTVDTARKPVGHKSYSPIDNAGAQAGVPALPGRFH